MMQTQNVTEEKQPYRTYKDRVFRMLFKDRKRLLELYNALNDTHYGNVEDLSVNTLENAIYMKMKNDISFIIDCNMCLYEHQSSYCPNMPLRGFLYFADLYKKILKDTDLSINRQIRIPTPHYIVFYNGLGKKEAEFTQKLSDAFEDDSDECIEKGILKDFFLEQKSEVIAMSIYEYNEEYVKKVLYEDGEASGYQKGEESGYRKGEAKTLVQTIESLMQNFHIELQKACEGAGTSIAEYEKAKQILEEQPN